VVTAYRDIYAKGYAIKLAKRTYFNELVNKFMTMNSLSAPMTFIRAKSKFLRYTPISNILFIIITLRIKSEKMISFSMTPINIPTKPKGTRF